MRIVLVALLAVLSSTVFALQVRETPSRFDALVVHDPSSSSDVAATPSGSLPASEPLRAGWDRFRAAHGTAWSIYLDRRSGAPLLAFGPGIPWSAGADSSLRSLETSLRAFVGGNRTLFLAEDTELVLDREASGQLTPEVWQIVFDRAIAGVPVAGEPYVFTIGYGNLISFGTPRWSRIDTSPIPGIDAREALERVSAYMELTAADAVDVVEAGRLQLIPLSAGPPAGPPAGPYAGPVGAGYTSALVWRLALRIAGEPGTWVAQIDAHTGAIRSFEDDNRYARVKGGVYPISDDHICPDGCEQAGYPAPFANITIGGSPQTANAMGLFTCAPAGSGATTTLAGPYVRVLDTCGPISQAVSCDNDLDLRTSGGIDCAVPAGSSAGNTHAARTGFYHLNRIAEHGRVWLPTRTWLTSQLTENVNINQACNAYWSGTSVNFFKSGGGCNNTGDLAGVILHEWGHGLDQNDGGGYDNPSEAYADVTAFLSTHASCVGRGFRQFGTCGGYGNTCLTCTGIRDQDWDQRVNHTPSTPAGFLTTSCGSGGGPCGKETHCEGYVGAETIWDLATRDLPASGLDPATSWRLADKLWYKSRLGSGGNAYNCALPLSDGCGANSWFSKLRAIDDDDGNLANGTPHAGAIYAAFNRHKIACGAASDASNQNSTVCPAIGATSLSVTAGSAAANLTWTPVAGATGYRILRNDAGCQAGLTAIATVPGTAYQDTGLANDFALYYSVQGVGANSACDGALSSCQGVTPQPFAGTVKLDASLYSCSSPLTVTVVDSNIGAETSTAKVASTTEPAGETVTLTRAAPGSAEYIGTISATPGDPSSDGQVSAADGDTFTATYIDANDGQGGSNLTRLATAATDCAFPVISKVQARNVTGSSARITWNTDEAATSVVRFGTVAPPGSTNGLSPQVIGHAVDLTGLAACTPYVYSVESADALGNVAIDDAAGVYHAFTTGEDTVSNYSSIGGPIAIPDTFAAGVTSTITVQDARTVQDVNVTVNITHTWDNDLTLALIPPTGPTINLSLRRGGSDDDYVDTVFDDEAATSIVTGSAPFTGSFRPESPLSLVDGINAAGAWKLKVVDVGGEDEVGTIDGWTLTLTFSTASCGPHAVYQAHALVADSCPAGGAGHLNTIWDAGERVQFKVMLANDGTTALTGVTATITSTTPGVVISDGTASYPDLAEGASADSLAPHVAAVLPTSATCGGTVAFQVSITSNEGNFSGAFVHTVGQPAAGTGTVLDETFSAGVPATWTVADGGSGGGTAGKWTTANPGVRTIALPMLVPAAIVDSDTAGPAATQDEGLITPAMSPPAASTVTLQFDQYFRWYSGGQDEIADVDVRSSVTGGAWVNVLRQQGASSANPDHRSVDITTQAAGAPDAQVRFRYHGGQFEWFWQVDNVKVDAAAPASCDMTTCIAGPGSARPVADGSFGTAMKGSRADAAGSTIDLTWDVATCASSDHHVLYGDLASVASAAISGASCDLGIAGSATWTAVPAGDLWFVVVGDDDGAVEGSWGIDGNGAQRGGTSASGRCSMTSRDNSETCP